MKFYLAIGFVFILESVAFSQNSVVANNDTSLIQQYLKDQLEVKNYNYSDTAGDNFAQFYIKNSFENHKISLEEMNEIPLTSNSTNEQYLFRILSLPSFYHPVCFTISAKNNQPCLHWTIAKGLGCYKPKGVKKRGKVKLSKHDWEYFKQLIDISSIDTLPLASYLSMTDGTFWIIEKNIDTRYKIYFSNILPKKTEDGYTLLLHISGVKTEEITQFYNKNEIRLFDKNNALIDLNPIRETIINNLNQNFHDQLHNKDYCFDCGLYLKINKREKVSSVKYIPYELPPRSFADRFEYWQENYQDRKFRHAVKKSLRKQEFQGLTLSAKIWVPVYIKYNENKNLLEPDNQYEPN
jgi:hypothetical protein